jgi:uncharacterized protein (UPF0210 family)
MACPGLVKKVFHHRFTGMKESRETHTPGSLALVLAQVKGIVATIEAAKILMESTGVEHVDTLRKAGRETGCAMLQGFADALRNSVTAEAMKALQSRAPALSALSAGSDDGSIQSDSSGRKLTKHKAADKEPRNHKAK